MPHEHSDAPVRKRSVISIAEPKGEEGTLLPLFERVAELLCSTGLEQVKPPGESGWKWGTAVYAFQAIVDAHPEVRTRLFAMEEGG
jgi:hypothetical protein